MKSMKRNQYNSSKHARYCDLCYKQITLENHSFTQIEISEAFWVYHCTKCAYEYPVD